MYNYYPEELIEEIRINNDIVDVVGEYVKLEKKGKDYFGLCPFHREKTPSFSVAPTKQIFYCFGCGKGGNVIQFTMYAENLDYIEAVRHLADRARIELPEGESEEEKARARLKQELVKINTEAARFYFGKLNAKGSQKALDYLRNRGIGEQTARRFGLGYSSSEWDALYKHLLDKGFEENAVVNSGLVIRNKTGGYFDRFRDRIMFPIFDLRGNVIGFGGRVIDNSMPKYMNSPETAVYSKGKGLYAMNMAKNSGKSSIIIVEGYMDVISLHQNGIINTVASLGTALTESQGRILKKYAEEIIISYDADVAGQAATLRGLELLNEIGCNVRVLIIPQGKDPDEFIRRNGVEAFRKILDNALTLVEYKIRALKNGIDTDSTEGKISFLNKAADILVKVDNGVEREMHIKKLSKEYEVSEEALGSEIIRKLKPRGNYRSTRQKYEIAGQTTNSGVKDRAANNLSHDERMLLALLCIDNSVYYILKDEIAFSALAFSDGQNREISAFVMSKLEKKEGITPAELLSVVEGNVAADFTRIIQKECNCEDNRKAVLDIIKRIELHKLDTRQREILGMLSNADNLKGDVEKLKLELKSIVLKKKGLQI